MSHCGQTETVLTFVLSPGPPGIPGNPPSQEFPR